MRLHICVEQGQPLPCKGDTILARGFAGTYKVRIREIIRQDPMGDRTLVEIEGTKKLVEAKNHE